MLVLERPQEQSSFFQFSPLDPSPMMNASPESLGLDAHLHPHQQQQQQQQQQQALFTPYTTADLYSFVPQHQQLTLDAQLFYQNKVQASSSSPKLSSPLNFHTSSSTGDQLSSFSPSASTHSLPSASSSSIGSPYQDQWLDFDPSIGPEPVTMVNDGYPNDLVSAGLDPDMLFANDKFPNCFVDPALLQPMQQNNDFPIGAVSYPDESQYQFIQSPAFAPVSPHSPLNPIQAPVQLPLQQQPQPPQQSMLSPSPYLHQNTFAASGSVSGRRSSISSIHSRRSARTPPRGVIEADEEAREKGKCPHPDCGRVIRDLKAHMLTHQSERPEKCPIVTCEYHSKGFARKYDKNRHTLTHYKGTMVCGFCPGSGSAAEKSFNRADVFKRHLTSVHGVDQSAPNNRKRSPPAISASKLSNYCQDATGKCSTCTATFNNAQEFYEHLDDCVLRVVQREEPSEAINYQRLAEVASDIAVRETMERHMLSTETTNDHELVNPESPSKTTLTNTTTTTASSSPSSHKNPNSGKGSIKSNTLTKPTPNPAGITKPRATTSRRRNNRNNYPPSWGCPTPKMKMKRRVLCVYDGKRRLWKDEMMMDNEFEVRLKLDGGDGMGRDAYVTDLDVETLNRSTALHNATEEEKGPWIPEGMGSGGRNALVGPAAVPVLVNPGPGDLGDDLNLDDLL